MLGIFKLELSLPYIVICPVPDLTPSIWKSPKVCGPNGRFTSEGVDPGRRKRMVGSTLNFHNDVKDK